MSDLPSGTVAFLLTDIEGSTQLWEHHPEAMQAGVARHDHIITRSMAEFGGHIVKSLGDGFLVAFSNAAHALRAAVEAQRSLTAEQWGESGSIRVRMALHAGPADERDNDYYGPSLNRTARLLASAHGGQILLSSAVEALTRELLPDGVTLRDLGERRLKDLVHPERIHQVVAAGIDVDFPPLTTLDARPNNLPVQPTTFIRREQELEDVRQTLAKSRCVTLVGPGGIGKTRLALQVAADQVDRYRDGVWLVELAPLTDGRLVPREVASSLSLQEQPGRTMLATLLETLESREMLLILDNCEHLVDACAELTGRLLRTCPDVTVLATSREVLGVPGEHRWMVSALSVPESRNLPPLSRLGEFESIRLFVERASMVVPGFTLSDENAGAIAGICRQLDGIPLAIELAAARVNVLTPQQIASRLDDRFRVLVAGSRTVAPRQQTLRALMDWSYDLLSDQERLLFARLGVFAGGFTLETVEAVCGYGGIDEYEVLDLLTHLVDKSLVLAESRDGEPRYRMLETLREYARHHLDASSGVSRMRQRHAQHFRDFAELAEPKLNSTDQRLWLDRLEADLDNLRATMSWSEEHDLDVGLRTAAALWRFWWLRGYLSEGRAQLEQLFDRESTTDPVSVRLKARHALGILSFREGDYTAARACLDEVRANAEELGDRRLLATVLRDLGRMTIDQGDFPHADRFLQRSLEIEQSLSDESGVAWTLGYLALLRHFQGDNMTASRLLDDGLDRFQILENRFGTAVLLYYSGNVAFDRDDYDLACRNWSESLQLSWTHRFLWPVPYQLEGFAALAVVEHRYDRAVRLAGAASRARSQVTTAQPPAWRSGYQRRIDPARLALSDSAYAAAWGDGQGFSLEEAVQYALAHERTA